MICLKKTPKSHSVTNIENPIEIYAFAGLTECAILRHKTFDRSGNFEFFENFRNVVDNAHASFFDPFPLLRDASDEKPLKTYDVSIQKHSFACQNMVFLVRTSPQ